MKNYLSPGYTVTVTAPANVVSGQAIAVGSLTGICVADALSGEDVEITRVGEFELVKVSADVVTAGARLYLDGSGRATITAGSNKFLGVALEDAGNGVGTVRGLLTGAHHL